VRRNCTAVRKGNRSEICFDGHPLQGRQRQLDQQRPIANDSISLQSASSFGIRSRGNSGKISRQQVHLSTLATVLRRQFHNARSSARLPEFRWHDANLPKIDKREEGKRFVADPFSNRREGIKMPSEKTDAEKLQEISIGLRKAINVCWDVTMPASFSSVADPVQCVRDLQSLLVETLEQSK
jgi:hypothetical protein